MMSLQFCSSKAEKSKFKTIDLNVILHYYIFLRTINYFNVTFSLHSKFSLRFVLCVIAPSGKIRYKFVSFAISYTADCVLSYPNSKACHCVIGPRKISSVDFRKSEIKRILSKSEIKRILRRSKNEMS